jgi:hypothetical protein
MININRPEGAVKNNQRFQIKNNINRPEGAVKNNQHLQINNKYKSPRRSGPK